MSQTCNAPALIKGLLGIPCVSSSSIIELNAWPEGSRPTLSHKVSPYSSKARVKDNTLDMLCIEKGISASPALNTCPEIS